MALNWKHNVPALVVVALAAAGGCARNGQDIEPRPGPVKGMLPAEADRRADEVKADPVAYLERVGSATRALNQYTLLFTRYERRGLFGGRLHGPEHIEAWFRRAPFSVRLKWLNEDLKYGESSYVAGQHGDKVRFVTRWWTPPLLPPPAINRVDLKTPVIWGESKRPLTDFGLEKLMERTLASLQQAGEQVVVTYEGLSTMPGYAETVHHVRLVYSDVEHPVPIQELYIDAVTDLPVGTVLKHTDGRVDSAYYYQNLNPDVVLTDHDFLLEQERGVASSQPTPPARAASHVGDGAK